MDYSNDAKGKTFISKTKRKENDNTLQEILNETTNERFKTNLVRFMTAVKP